MQKFARGFVCRFRSGVAKLPVAVQAFENSLGGENTVVLRFFENGDAAEVGVGEEKAGIAARWCEAKAFLGENRADGGADHGVAHAHDVDARDALANVGVDALEVVENGLLPIIPVLVEKELAILRGSAVDKRPVKSPDGSINVRAQALMSGVDVAEGGRV